MEAQHKGRVGYSQRAEKSLSVTEFGEQGMVHEDKRMEEWRTDVVQVSGLCGSKCDVPIPPHPYCMCTFSLCQSSPTSHCAILRML